MDRDIHINASRSKKKRLPRYVAIDVVGIIVARKGQDMSDLWGSHIIRWIYIIHIC